MLGYILAYPIMFSNSPCVTSALWILDGVYTAGMLEVNPSFNATRLWVDDVVYAWRFSSKFSSVSHCQTYHIVASICFFYCRLCSFDGELRLLTILSYTVLFNRAAYPLIPDKSFLNRRLARAGILVCILPLRKFEAFHATLIDFKWLGLLQFNSEGDQFLNIVHCGIGYEGFSTG